MREVAKGQTREKRNERAKEGQDKEKINSFNFCRDA